MTTSGDFGSQSPLLPLADLFSQYLHRRTTAHEAGFASTESSEVVPFEAVPVQPIDARLAWTESQAALRFFQPNADTRSWPAPPDWTDLVAAQEPALGLALATGNFPQAVRNLNPLLQNSNLAGLRPGHAPGSVRYASGLAAWASLQKRWPQLIHAVGILRLAKDFDRAWDLVKRHQGEVPAEWRAAWANEQAALAWHQGETDRAVALWQAQDVSAPILFNRGMSALFSDQPNEARTWLAQAAGQIPEESSWHHLCRLYLALAEMRL
jgi:hypothetical protein